MSANTARLPGDCRSCACGESIARRGRRRAIDGSAPAGTAAASRRRRQLCGDGVLDWDEGCDDGNTQDGDGCRADLHDRALRRRRGRRRRGLRRRQPHAGRRLPRDSTAEACGDGILDANEVCDTANTSGGERVPSNCTEAACTTRSSPRRRPRRAHRLRLRRRERAALAAGDERRARQPRGVRGHAVSAGRLQQASGVTVLYDDGRRRSRSAPLWVHLPARSRAHAGDRELRARRVRHAAPGHARRRLRGRVRARWHGSHRRAARDRTTAARCAPGASTSRGRDSRLNRGVRGGRLAVPAERSS